MSDDVEMGKVLNTDENLMRERHFRTLDNFYYVKDFCKFDSHLSTNQMYNVSFLYYLTGSLKAVLDNFSFCGT